MISLPSHKIFKALVYLALLVGCTCDEGLKEESIFEDEDIYRVAMPPKNTTSILVPGTKWCGPGHAANDYNDLGRHRDTDACCREHDHCEQVIESQSSGFDIANNDMFPILHCNCEQKFLNCLQRVNSIISNTLGYIYYGARSKCLSYGHPIESCKQYMAGTFRRRCIRYNINSSKEQIWQLYDMPFYTTSSKSITV